MLLKGLIVIKIAFWLYLIYFNKNNFMLKIANKSNTFMPLS